jgi:hypothetical protein
LTAGRTATTWIPDQKHASTASVNGSVATSLNVYATDADAATTCKGDAGGPALRESNGIVERAM